MFQSKHKIRRSWLDDSSLDASTHVLVDGQCTSDKKTISMMTKGPINQSMHLIDRTIQLLFSNC